MAFSQAANGVIRKVPVWPAYLLGVLPAFWLFWLGLSGSLGADPVKALEHQYGKLALQLLIAGLAVTPLRRFAGINLLRFRRAIGLLAFLYVALHLTVWLVLDIQLNWRQVWVDIVERPYITIGMAGFAVLVPLALTSNDAALRRMGALAWRRLHRLTYAATLAGALHYTMSVKVWAPEPFLYAAVILGLLAVRLPFRRNERRRGESVGEIRGRSPAIRR